ncbi:50S ribosomal protein L11 methyltransferase [Anaeroselena agilis]|uniref:Ribosomal protein L11 methyltransferase n=1 Tax=Anaeroselena agilis TaxID=3063788 RepID=A0ABU3NYV1_9FIRM|nr:50S ribosomal protein L11 methyltransferase [Selenomonadales bacterium 4137-cl]
MKWAEISIQTTHEATEAVADIFHGLGASGVVIEDPELVNSYKRSGTWDYCDIPEAEDDSVVTVKAYLPADDQLDDKLRVFERQVDELARHDIDKGRGLIRLREVREEDWANAWKAYYHPIRVGERLVVKPSWQEYPAARGDVVVELDPGMAFGTGTHHTTAMCLELLEEALRPGDTVFDVGTGSGILAVAAAKLGAGEVQAVDNDPLAVRIAGENVAANGTAATVTVSEGDLLTGLSGRADFIIANIIADVIIRMAPSVPDRLKEGGLFLAGGVIADRLGDVTDAIITAGLEVEKVLEEGGWASILARRGDE